jgi:hypothetical protein
MLQTNSDEPGKDERDYEFYTNDPDRPEIIFALAVAIDSLPDWIGRVPNANVILGSRLDNFVVWPTADPQIRMAKGETLKLTLRVTAAGLDVNKLAAEAAAKQQKLPTAPPQSGGGNGGSPEAPATPIPLPNDKLTYHIRDGSVPGVHWLDIDVGPLQDAGLFSYSLSIPATAGKLAGLALNFNISVVVDELVVMPTSLDFGEITLPEQKDDSVEVGRFRIRRPLRSFHIKEMSASAPFIRLAAQTISESRNYIIKVSVVNDPGAKPGLYEGKIRVVTDDKLHPVIEVPFKIKLVR